MSTERSSFGLNSFLPSGYMSKAEAFAKCLQDKLRNLGGGDESSERNGEREESPKVFNRFSEEEIADNVFLQGPLLYKRRSIPERSSSDQNNVNGKPKYFGSLVDKRGLSSDSEDSDSEDVAAIHPRIAQLQNDEEVKLKRLASVTSVDSTSSWCSCDEGPDPDDDDEVIDALALQIKGSPPISNPRLRNFRRKGKEEKARKEKPAPTTQDADLFFDFDVECFSPVSVEEEAELFEGFQSAQLRLSCEGLLLKTDEIAQLEPSKTLLQQPSIITPPPSPVNEKVEIPCLFGAEIKTKNNDNAEKSVSILSEGSPSSDELKSEIPIGQLSEAEPFENESVQSGFHHYYKAHYAKDSGIGSCEETSSRTGDEDFAEVDGSVVELIDNEEEGETNEEVRECQTQVEEVQECNPEDYIEKKRDVTAPVMVMCEGVLVEESYLPSPRMKLRRCSSLKTWKTPPGTPGRKKIVRFADSLGLDLADVRTFLDEIPKIPISAFQDLHYELPPVPPPPTTQRTLIPMFQQPGTQSDFLQRVRQSNVCLESAILTDVTLLSIAGIVRVRNLSFNKTVHVRYSKDQWLSFSDLQATFVPNSSDGFCDNFSFTLYGHTLDVGNKLEFAIRYDCGAGQFWDNNLGCNYVFQCMPRNNTLLFPPLGSSPVDTWSKFY